MHIQNNHILDDENRTLILRGVNLGGDSKCPFGERGSETTPSFLKRSEPREKVSFVGRPFPLETAQEHFHRLKRAGMTFLRLVITWEAIEHEGPGIYDEEYLAYLRKILLTAESEGISVFIDPHQDVWSRWTGGDGAPAWTMEKLGMDLDNVDCCGAAITRQRYGLYHKSKKHPGGDPFPRMIWPSNYNRYAAETMFTLFFAGKTYAPDLMMDGENVQDFLQNRYIAAFMHARRRLKNCGAIAGWGVMNEPHFGFIGQKNLEDSENFMIPGGLRPSPWQAICAASGHPVKAPVYNIIGKNILHHETLNPEGISLFKEGCSCPWKLAGVWKEENGEPILLRKDHFSGQKGGDFAKGESFVEDFLKPFIIKFINTMKEKDDKDFFFIEGIPPCTIEDSHPSWKDTDPTNVINAFHWYDGFSLFTKSFRSWFTLDPDTAKVILGKKKVGSFFADCLAEGIGWTKQKMGNMPSFLGEFGLAFDLNNRHGLTKGDYSVHEEALSMYYDAVDANLLHSTIWNYTANNTNKYGDGWNDEDLSIFSEGKERAGKGWKRPYPMATAGKIMFFKWNRRRGEFNFLFFADAGITAPTIIYLPAESFGPSPKIEVKTESNLKWEYSYEDQRLLVYNNGLNEEVKISVRASARPKIR